MVGSYEERRLIELLYLRDRSLQRLRRSTDLREVWTLYQDIKLLSQHIERLERSNHALP